MATGSGSQDVKCPMVAWTSRACASHGSWLGPSRSASAVPLATSVRATMLSSSTSRDHRSRLGCLTSGHRSEAAATLADRAR